MNTDRLGGAERSMLHQLANQNKELLYFLIPQVSKCTELEEFIKDFGFRNVIYFKYPKALYVLSRKAVKLNLGIIYSLIEIFLQKDTNEILKNSDVIYLNGNKAALYYFLKNQKLALNKKIIWHFRDYWQGGKYLNFFWSLITKRKEDNFLLISNSYSTQESLQKSPFSHCNKAVVYNPSGLPIQNKKSSKVETLGFVSMLAPWKGIHEIILWAKMYEDDLLAIGIKKINFYGANLYLTEGPHVGYADQLSQLVKKLNPRLVNFVGNVDPKNIYSEIDCLIHYSLEDEPFGRVLIEAFQNNVPAISTCLGGASELIIEKATGLGVIKYDLAGLMEAVKTIVENDQLRFSITSSASKRSISIERGIESEMKQIFEEYQAG
jgi:glycosyltransferase involved in cell wall biosynthesis